MSDTPTDLEILLGLIIKKNIALSSTHPTIERVKYMISFFDYSPIATFSTDNVVLIEYAQKNGYTVVAGVLPLYNITVPTAVPSNIT